MSVSAQYRTAPHVTCTIPHSTRAQYHTVPHSTSLVMHNTAQYRTRQSCLGSALGPTLSSLSSLCLQGFVFVTRLARAALASCNGTGRTLMRESRVMAKSGQPYTKADLSATRVLTSKVKCCSQNPIPSSKYPPDLSICCYHICWGLLSYSCFVPEAGPQEISRNLEIIDHTICLVFDP